VLPSRRRPGRWTWSSTTRVRQRPRDSSSSAAWSRRSSSSPRRATPSRPASPRCRRGPRSASPSSATSSRRWIQRALRRRSAATRRRRPSTPNQQHRVLAAAVAGAPPQPGFTPPYLASDGDLRKPVNRRVAFRRYDDGWRLEPPRFFGARELIQRSDAAGSARGVTARRLRQRQKLESCPRWAARRSPFAEREMQHPPLTRILRAHRSITPVNSKIPT